MIGVSWQEGVAFINFSGSTTFSEKDFKKICLRLMIDPKRLEIEILNFIKFMIY